LLRRAATGPGSLAIHRRLRRAVSLRYERDARTGLGGPDLPARQECTTVSVSGRCNHRGEEGAGRADLIRNELQRGRDLSGSAERPKRDGAVVRGQRLIYGRGYGGNEQPNRARTAE